MHAAMVPVYWQYKTALVEAARLWRPFLSNVVFIGVTGSAGKTTAKELIVAMLARRLRGGGSYITENRPEHVAKTILKRRASDDFCVVEMSADRPGAMDRSLAMVRPRIGVVTTVRDDHLSVFASRQAIADEKGKLIAAVPADGTAVLNADDELVAAMRERCAGRVLTYGVSPGADVRAEHVGGTWPDRLHLTVAVGSTRLPLQTQLCGTHWTSTVLAAIATGVSLGIPLEDCTTAIAATRPLLARMEPVTDSQGVTFIRDDWKAPLWTTDAAFDFMRQAQARRKVIVIGTLSDYGGDASAQYARVAERALAIAERVIFVGAWASRALRARGNDGGRELRAFSNVRHASEYLNTVLQTGDLVLLKGTNRKDHLVRIVLARTGQVRCWSDDCGLNAFCTTCRKLSVPSGPASAPSALHANGIARERREPTFPAGMQVVIALGNPGARFARTPHNIGHQVAERLSERLSGDWGRQDAASIARTLWSEREVCLIKLETPVNRSGLAIKNLAERLGFEPGDCILVHDDLDLPLGTVRVRMRGSAGGHRGVASVLDVFQTDAVRRVKLGIGRPDAKDQVKDYVLKPFPDADRPLVDQACAVAVDRVLDLIVKGSQNLPTQQS